MTRSVAGWALCGLLVLGCGGLMGFGNEVARAFVPIGSPWSVTYTAATPEPHQLWIEYDLTHTSKDYSIVGDIVATPASGRPTTWQLDLHKSGAPVSGSRLTMNASETRVGPTTTVGATIWAVELPSVPAGTDVTLSGTWTAGAKTVPGGVQVIVTD